MSRTIESTATTFGTDIHGASMMSPNDKVVAVGQCSIFH